MWTEDPKVGPHGLALSPTNRRGVSHVMARHLVLPCHTLTLHPRGEAWILQLMPASRAGTGVFGRPRIIIEITNSSTT